MNNKNDKRESEIYDFVNNCMQNRGFSPTTDEICREFGIAKSTASKFINRLIERGLLEKCGRYGLALTGRSASRRLAPIVGSVACGKPIRGCVAFLGGPLHFMTELKNAFIRTLKLTEENIVDPENSHLFAAMGAALKAGEDSATDVSVLVKKLSDGGKITYED